MESEHAEPLRRLISAEIGIADPQRIRSVSGGTTTFAVQGSHYGIHGLAKAWVGKRWYSCVVGNRIEHLAIIAYLRGRH